MSSVLGLGEFPLLRTPRLVLRQLRLSDADAILQVFSNPEVTRYYDLDTFIVMDQAVRLIDRVNERFDLGTAIRWGMALAPDNRVVGTCGLFFHPPGYRAELGFDLARPYWGRGLMREALCAVLAYGFERLDLNRMEALVMPGNEASVRLLRRLGFQEEGTLREYAFFKERFHDLRCFSLLAREYRAVTPGSI